MSRKLTPLGGKLINRMLKGKKKEKAKEEAVELPSIPLDREAAINLEMIAVGVLSPNEGFMDQEDYRSVLYNGRLESGLPWTIPITFAPAGKKNAEVIKGLKEGEDIALVDDSGDPLAILHLEERFAYDKEERARQVFGTTERRHPGVDNLFTRRGDISLAGPIDMILRKSWGPFEKMRLEPADTWRIFYEEKRWETIVGFQTANPLHRGHEYLQKCALEIFDGLFINPVVETTRRAYFRNEFRIKAYEAALKTYYPKDSVILAPLRVTMLYAGPKEAILHALIRRNFGCTHIILGRDHAGFEDYYPKYAAQEIFEEYSEDEIGIEPIFFREAFYCTRCASIATDKSCPHGEEYHLTMSGTGSQDILRYGYAPPKEIMRPEVTQVALQGIQPKGVDENGIAMNPPGDTVEGLFPFYLSHHRLGGYPRDQRLDPSTLTIHDLELALRDARESATRIYEDVYEEIAHFFDISRNIAARQKTEALAEAIERQKDLIAALEEKAKIAEERVHDPFMYQDKAEAERELEVAKRILDDFHRPIEPERFKERVWNPMEFEKYRHTLDVSGEVCPTTLIETQRKVEEIEDGDELLVITDFHGATETIPRWALKAGYDVQVNRKGTSWEILIKKGKKQKRR
ncbi:MAG: sulfate adenylyltransferase [Candidatus Hydrothermarchaeales archaeon]